MSGSRHSISHFVSRFSGRLAGQGNRRLPRLRPRALGAWLALAFSGLSIVLTLLLVGLLGDKATSQVKSAIGNNLAELAAQTSDKLDRGMFERYREVDLLARRGVLRPDTPAAQRRALLEQLQAGYPLYSWIGVAGLDGWVQVAAHRVLEGANVGQRPWFRNALHGKYVGDVHEAVLLASALPYQVEPWRFVDVAFPVTDGAGKAQGVLGVHLSWQWARDIERSVMAGRNAGHRVEALVVSADGQVLLGPPDVNGRRLALASLRAARSLARTGYAVETWPDGKQYLVGFARGRGYATYPGLGWTVLVRQDLVDAYAPVRRLREYGLGAGVLLAALFLLAGVVLAHRITRPLKALARAAEHIRTGAQAGIAPYRSRGDYREVDVLAGALDTLVTDLEGRVAARTAELERALVTVRASRQRIINIVETAQDAYIGVDLHGAITEWNTAARRMFGWRRLEIVGRPIETVVPARFHDAVRRALRRFIDTGELGLLARRYERVMLDRDGVEIPVEMSTGLVGTGEGAFFSMFVQDISARKEVERLKDEFVATVSHELRTPLTSISVSLALLSDGSAGPLPDDARQLIEIANASSGRLVRLINDVLDLQKMDAGAHDLRRTVQPLLPVALDALEAMQAMAADAGVGLACAPEPGAALLCASIDRDRIIQVLTNLLSNAIKFSEAGAQVTLALDAHGDRVRLRVIDRGAGIPEAFRAQVFQRFAQADATDTRRRGGTGLGLSITKSIVERHGGRIRFDSVVGAGTTFTVELPAAGAVDGV